MLQDLRSIQIIRTVAYKGTVSAAAESLGISQPALTKKIQAIESALDLTLFKRDGKGAVLTSAGEFFLEQSASLVLLAEDLNKRLNAFRDGNGGELRIGSKTGLDDAFFTNVMLTFIQENPGPLVEVDIDTTPSLVDRIESGELDIALIARGYPDKTGLDCTQNPAISFVDLCALTFSLVVREGHPVLETDDPLKHIFHYPLACPKAPVNILRAVGDAQAKVNAPYPCPNILIDDYDAVFKVISASDHWTAVPRASAAAIQRTQTLHCIDDKGAIPALEIGYATRKHWTPIPSALHFIRLVKQAVDDLPESFLASSAS